ncbi:hypothetical protein C8Q75DRAFT_777083 [Abortiporus biennis]|nr:hypothetical protein C8Q75DRAFT_777083 [Abortiporus biennis]
MPYALTLPAGPKPGWELEEEFKDEEGRKLSLHSIPQSPVLLKSLRQSREKWLSNTFPRFSSKVRSGRPGAIQPPPHTVRAFGRFTLQIGPHVFSDTAIYEVHYIPQTPPAPVQTPRPSAPPLLATGITPYGAPTSTSTPSFSIPTPPTYTPLLSDSFVTPQLINQVNAAAASNPVLANLLKLATSGEASQDQLQTLGLLIKTLGNRNIAAAASSSTLSVPNRHTTQYPPTPVDDRFDIVIEFHERPGDRWIIPRGILINEFEPPIPPATRGDMVMRIILPFLSDALSATRNPNPHLTLSLPPFPEIVTLQWQRVTPEVVDMMTRWLGSEKSQNENKTLMKEALSRPPKRTFLQYQLPDGDLLSQIQAAVAPPAPAKSIKPTQADSTRSRRRSTTSRKAAHNQPTTSAKPPTPVAAEQLPPPSTPVSMPPPSTPVSIPPSTTPASLPLSTAQVSLPPLATPVSLPQPTEVNPSVPAPISMPPPSLPPPPPPSMKMVPVIPIPRPPSPKRRKSSHRPKPSTPVPICCHSCGQTDVPLMMGGRYCRQCIDAGRAKNDIPQITKSYGTSHRSTPGRLEFQTTVNPTVAEGTGSTPTAGPSSNNKPAPLYIP